MQTNVIALPTKYFYSNLLGIFDIINLNNIFFIYRDIDH